MTDQVTHRELEDSLQDERAETGLILARFREDWREELKLRLDNHLKKTTLLLVVFFVGLKFNIPTELSGGAVGLVGLKAALGFFRSN